MIYFIILSPLHLYSIITLQPSMAYLSSFFQIDRLIKLEHVSLHFDSILQETDIFILISSYLTVKELIQFSRINKRAFQLRKIPTIQVRVLKGELNKIKNGQIESQQLNPNNLFINLKLSTNNSALSRMKRSIGIPDFFIKMKQIKNSKDHKEKPKTKNQPSLPQDYKIEQTPEWMKKQISLSPFFIPQVIEPLPKPIQTQTVIQQITWVSIEPPTIKQTFEVLHTQLLNKLQEYYSEKQEKSSEYPTCYFSKVQEGKIKRKNGDLYQQQENSLMKSAMTKVGNLVDLLKFSLSR